MEPQVHRLISRALCGMQVVNCRMEEFEQSQPVPTPVRTDKLGLLTSEKRKLVQGRMSLHSSSRIEGGASRGREERPAEDQESGERRWWLAIRLVGGDSVSCLGRAYWMSSQLGSAQLVICTFTC